MITSLRGTPGTTGVSKDRGRKIEGGTETERAAGRDMDRDLDIPPAGATTSEARPATNLKLKLESAYWTN